MNTQVLGISIDHVPSLKAWADSLGGIRYPLLSDFWPHGEVCERYGVLRIEGYAERAIFLIDRAGIIRYVDIHNIDEQPSNLVLLEEIHKADSTLPKVSKPVDDTNSELPHGGIILYCTKWCADCRRAKNWLDEHNLPYTEVDVNASALAAKQVRAWCNGKLITPTFDIDGVIVQDFSISKLEQALKL